MRVVVIWMMCFTASIAFGQGLNSELGFNDEYSQKAKGMVAFEDYSIFVKEQTFSASFFTRSSIIKIDTLGNPIWEISIAPQSAEVVLVSEIIPSENNGIYVLGYARPSCDVSGGCFWFLQKIDFNGSVEWQQIWNDQICFGVNASGLTLSQGNELLVHVNDPLSSKIYTFDSNGNDISNINISLTGFQGTDQLSGYHSIAFKQSTLYGFDNAGNTTLTKSFSSFINDAVVLNDSLYLLTKDSIFIFDPAFQTIASGIINGFDTYQNLKVRDTDIRLTSVTNSEINLFQLNRNLQVVASQSIAVLEPEDQPLDYTDEHLAIATTFALSEYFGIRHLNFSLVDPQNAFVNRTDIGIAEIQITQASITPNLNFNAVFQVEIAADVLVKNYGTNVLSSCRLNHYVSPALACGLIYYGEEVFNINLAPGDSVWIPLGVIHTNERSFPTDSLNQEICIYTSFPNSVTDLNVSNDRRCTTVTLGTASVSQLEVEDKKLIKIVDLLGRETNSVENQWVLYLYDDGSTEKRLQISE